MKFGNTFSQRSVQQWRHHNLDYMTLKRLIKVHTDPSAKAPATAMAVSIPGQGPSASDAFDEKLLAILQSECARLDMFVRSKMYELQSRLSTIDRFIGKLQTRRQVGSSSRNATSLQQRFARLETELLRVGEEIQNTARFVATNRMAVQKLVKKHRKWTGSPDLTARVQNQLLDPPGSFANFDLSPFMERYEAQLKQLRSAVSPPAPAASTPPLNVEIPRQPAHSAPSPAPTVNTMELDLALFKGAASDKHSAVYWVHADNLVELRVLLLQHTRSADVQPSTPSTPQQAQVDASCRDTAIGLVAMSTDALHARWAGLDAALVLNDDDGAVLQATLERVHLARLLTGGNADALADSDDLESARRIQVWIERNAAQVSPLARVCATRSRFVGFDGSLASGPIAALDTGIVMERTSPKAMADVDYFKSAPLGHMTAFPHAVLTVGANNSEGLVKALDASHLTERVAGFSLSRHAVATCCRPNAFPEPDWMPKLSQDIRHLPPVSGPPSRRTSVHGASSGRMSPRATSATTITASDGPVTPSVTAQNIRPRVITLDTSVKRNVRENAPLRYWNEFDHPEEGDEEEPFMVEVYPDDSPFPGLPDISAWSRKFGKFFKKLKRSPRSGNSGQSPTSESSDEEDTAEDAALTGASNPSGTMSPRSKRHRKQSAALLKAAAGQDYGTINAARPATAAQQRYQSQWDRLQTPVLFIVAASLITLLMAVIAVTSRRKTHPVVEVVLILGCAASFLFQAIGLMGVASAVRRTQVDASRLEQGLDEESADAEYAGWPQSGRDRDAWTVPAIVLFVVAVTTCDISLVAWELLL